MVRKWPGIFGGRIAYLILAFTSGISFFFTAGLIARACAWSGYPIYALVSCYADFEVANKSGIPIWVTPVGITEHEVRRVTLPMFRPKGQEIWTRRRMGIPLAPGGTIRLAYDFDQVQFSELLIQTEGGEERMLSIEPPGMRRGQYSPPNVRSINVPTFAGIPSASDQVKGYVDRERRRELLLLVLGLLAPMGWWLAQRGLRHNEEVSNAE